jgi:hypothetical protein
LLNNPLQQSRIAPENLLQDFAAQRDRWTARRGQFRLEASPISPLTSMGSRVGAHPDPKLRIVYRIIAAWLVLA